MAIQPRNGLQPNGMFCRKLGGCSHDAMEVNFGMSDFQVVAALMPMKCTPRRARRSYAADPVYRTGSGMPGNVAVYF